MAAGVACGCGRRGDERGVREEVRHWRCFDLVLFVVNGGDGWVMDPVCDGANFVSER